MSTYLKNMGGYKYNQLKSKSYDEIQKLFDNEMNGSKKAETSEKKAEGSKKKSIDEHEEAKEDDEAEMKKHMEVVQDDEEIEIDVIPLATKPLIIVEYKTVKEGQNRFYHLIKADGSLNRYSSMIRMLQNISREDLETLWKLTISPNVEVSFFKLLCITDDIEDMTFNVYALPCYGLVLFVMALFIHAL
ncbi:hypothetical protein Tco_0980369 [Tanacetum coccineum]